MTQGESTFTDDELRATPVPVTDAVLGATDGAAVVTDTDGFIQQYLRGLVKLWIAGLAAGSQIIGKVGIDQTTPGTTDSVSVATAQGAGATIGETTDPAVVTDVDGTIQQYLRGLVKLVVDIITVKIDQTTPGTTDSVSIATAQGAGATIGTTTDAAVSTDANGTLSAKLRGIIKLFVDKIFVKLHDGTNALTFISHESVVSVPVHVAHVEQFHVHLDVENLSASKGFMLIDLSDTTNWPHTNTGHIILQELVVNINPDTSFRGDVEFGFLSSVDATNGDLNIIMTFHLDRQAAEISNGLDFLGGLGLEAADWFGPTTADDTTWQTDVDLTGPDGATSYPSGDDDLVMLITLTAGAVDVGVTLLYETKT